MILALVLLSIAVAMQSSLGHPLDFDDTIEFSSNFDVNSGPWNHGSRWLGGNGGWSGGSRGLWPYDGYVENVDIDIGGGYSYPVRTVDAGRDRIVHDVAVAETDDWVRDRTTYRSQPLVRYGTSYGAWPVRRVYGSGIGGPRSSLRSGGNVLLKR